MARVFALLLAFAAVSCGVQDEAPWFIRGSARLPDCSEPATYNLDATRWFDDGTVTITSSGCSEPVGAQFSVCGLAWDFQQNGRDVEILVDHEYRILGRACGSQLYLEGGWWLALRDERGSCDYEDGTEVVIESGGSTLNVGADALTGTLAIAERCTGRYDVTFYPDR